MRSSNKAALILSALMLSAGAYAQGSGGSTGTKEPNETAVEGAKMKAEGKVHKDKHASGMHGDGAAADPKPSKMAGPDRAAVKAETKEAQKKGQLAPEKEVTTPINKQP